MRARAMAGCNLFGFDTSYRQQGHVDGFRTDKELEALAIMPIDSSCLLSTTSSIDPIMPVLRTFFTHGRKVVVMRRGRSFPVLRITKAREPQSAYYE